MTTVVAVLMIGIIGWNMVGAVAAATGLLPGRMASTTFLAGPALWNRRAHAVATAAPLRGA